MDLSGQIHCCKNLTAIIGSIINCYLAVFLIHKAESYVFTIGSPVYTENISDLDAV